MRNLENLKMLQRRERLQALPPYPNSVIFPMRPDPVRDGEVIPIDGFVVSPELSGREEDAMRQVLYQAGGALARIGVPKDIMTRDFLAAVVYGWEIVRKDPNV